MLYADEIPNFATSTHTGKIHWFAGVVAMKQIASPPHIPMKNERLNVFSKVMKLSNIPPVVNASISLIAPAAVLTKTLPGKY